MTTHSLEQILKATVPHALALPDPLEIFTKAITKNIQLHAKLEYPIEAIGVVVDGVYEPLENTAKGFADQSEAGTFDTDYMDELYLSGKLQAVIHSHPDGPHCPSRADMILQAQMGVPFGLVTTDGNSCTPVHFWGDSLRPSPLVGRGFVHGIEDCYEIIRDYYFLSREVWIPQFPRGWDWWLPAKDPNGDILLNEDGSEVRPAYNLYEEGFPRAGFYEIDRDDAREGDVVLFSVRSVKHNHGAVYLGDGTILHHVTGFDPYDPSTLSRREPIKRWEGFSPRWLRYDETGTLTRASG